MRSLIAALRNLVLPNGATTGQRIVLDSVNGVILVYDSTNALVGSIAATDSAGNWDAGVTAYDNVGAEQAAQLVGGALIFSAWNGTTPYVSDGLIVSDNSGTTVPVTLRLSPSTYDPSGSGAQFELNSAVAPANGYAVLADAASGASVAIDLLVSGVVYATDPGHINPTRESWHVVTPTLANGWVQNTLNYAPCAYRKMPDGDVQLEGALTGGTTADNTTLFTLPAGYRPAFKKSITATPGSNGGSMHVAIATTGVVQCLGIGAQGAFVGFDGIHFSTL